MSANVLVVDDDASMAGAMALRLEEEGFQVTTAADGRAALAALETLPIDLVTLDLGLPEMDGYAVCRHIRSTSAVPIVVVSARADASDVVHALELGADDYLTKPFDSTVLVARVRAVLRRYGDAAPRVRTCRDLVVDEVAFTAHKGEVELELTPIEMRLLSELVRHAGAALTRDHLLQEVWGYGYLGDSRLVDMAIRRLRAKLGDPPADPGYVTTVRGVGYRFEPGPDGAGSASLTELSPGQPVT